MYQNPFTDIFKKRNERKYANSSRSLFQKQLDVYCIWDGFQIIAVSTDSLCLSLSTLWKGREPPVARVWL